MLVAAAQIAPVLLDRAATLVKVVARIDEAAAEGCSMVCFPEAIVPGYPVWLERTGGARFDDADQKRMHALYCREAVAPDEGHLDDVRAAAHRGGITVVLGAIERAFDRGGHSLYCTLFVIGADGAILSRHRKLMPTHEERLSWSVGDGAGLVTHPLGDFRMGALNCWENWLPLARAALHAQGENLHVALWPGCLRNTVDLTRFIAFEGRSFVVSVSGILRASDIPDDVPLRDAILADGAAMLLDGGTAVAGPDGRWVVDPVVGEERLVTARIELARVREERQNLDISGHYSRPDVFSLRVDRRPQSIIDLHDV